MFWICELRVCRLKLVLNFLKHTYIANVFFKQLINQNLDQQKFKTCAVRVDLLTKGKDWYPFLEVNVAFNGTQYWGSIYKIEERQLCKRNAYLFSCSFKFQHANLPSRSASNEVEFKFSYSRRIKECGVRLLNVSSYRDYSDGSSEKEYK